MSLYTEWKDLLENQTDETFESFGRNTAMLKLQFIRTFFLIAMNI